MSGDLKSKRGAAGLLFVLCAIMGAAGAALDVTHPPSHPFWIAAQPGARALVGAGAALFALVAGHLVRIVLARRIKGETGHARDLV